MTTYVGSSEAAHLLGVSKPTLYAYVSRGLVDRRTAVDGRTSLYDREQLERIAARTRRRATSDRPSIDVRISSAITQLDDERLTYRGHDAVALSTTASFEQVAELLWAGRLPTGDVAWSVDRDELRRCQSVVEAASPVDPIARLALASVTLTSTVELGDPAGAGRLVLGLAPSILGGPRTGSTAARLARAWSRRPGDELVRAIDRALVLLADHELATSTLAVRVAASVRADPMSSITAGLATLRGPMHGAASREAADFLELAATIGATAAVRARLDARLRLPGFGHSVYRSGDPRFVPMLDAVRTLPDPDRRMATVEAVLVEAGRSVGHLPNVDLALGALLHVGGLPHDCPLFAVARIAGWIAHHTEELDERPLRFRGLTHRVEG